MNTKCRILNCSWSGSSKYLFDHCEAHHSDCIRESKSRNYFDFKFTDLTRDAFLLVHPQGTYWFCLDLYQEQRSDVNGLRRAVFHIDDSKPMEYTLKLGLIRDGYAEYLGPFLSSCNNTSQYDLEFRFDYIEFINENLVSHKMRLYFGEYDDSDDVYQFCSEELDWSNEKERQANQICLELFHCPVCFEYIRKDARFCDRKHYVCRKCFWDMYEKSKRKKQKFICPLCKEEYGSTYKDDDLNELLKMVKFPRDSTKDKCEKKKS